jgi:hypothetical protein
VMLYQLSHVRMLALDPIGVRPPTFTGREQKQ